MILLLRKVFAEMLLIGRTAVGTTDRIDAHGKVLAKPILVSVGSEDGTAVVDAGAIFREALKAGAEEIIVAHNHPSGNPTPSKADIAATARLQDGAELVGLMLIDHLIIGNGERFCSLAEMQLC